MQTEQTARETLPNVNVTLPTGATITAFVIGRSEPFATVWAPSHPFIGEWSWAAIVRSLTTGTPLTA